MGSDGRCCNCHCDAYKTGDGRPVSPVSVGDADGKGQAELWCPRCFVFKRMHLEPERYNAMNTAAVRCQFCGGESVCFFVARNGAAACLCCSRPGALKIRPTPEDEARIFQTVVDAAEEKGILKDVKRPRK